jgi:hypothetical protein
MSTPSPAFDGARTDVAPGKLTMNPVVPADRDTFARALARLTVNQLRDRITRLEIAPDERSRTIERQVVWNLTRRLDQALDAMVPDSEHDELVAQRDDLIERLHASDIAKTNTPSPLAGLEPAFPEHDWVQLPSPSSTSETPIDLVPRPESDDWPRSPEPQTNARSVAIEHLAGSIGGMTTPLHSLDERRVRARDAIDSWQFRMNNWIVKESDWLASNHALFESTTAGSPGLANGAELIRDVVGNLYGNGLTKTFEKRISNGAKHLAKAAGAMVGTALAPGAGTAIGFVIGVFIETAISQFMIAEPSMDIAAERRKIGEQVVATHRRFDRVRNVSIAALQAMHGLLRSRVLAEDTQDGVRAFEVWARDEAAHVPAPNKDDDTSLATSLLKRWTQERAESPTRAHDGTSQAQWEAARDTAFGKKGLRDQPDLFVHQLRDRLQRVGGRADEVERLIRSRIALDDDMSRPSTARAEINRARHHDIPFNLWVEDLDAFCRRFRQPHEPFKDSFDSGKLFVLAWPQLDTSDGSCFLKSTYYGFRQFTNDQWWDSEWGAE